MKIKKLNLSLTEELHRALKIKATNEGKPLYQYIIDILEGEINND